MPHDVLGEHPSFDVGRPAGREVDQEGEPLALVEGVVGVSACRADQRGAAERKPDRAHGRPHFFAAFM
jgi:hypothetical protein